MKPITLVAWLLVLPVPLAAQDPVKVDPKHYKLVYEDATIRVLRINYGPHEKSVMHEHPFGTCAIDLTDAQSQFTAPDGKVTKQDSKAGDVTCEPAKPGASRHLPENLGAKAMEVVLIERKAPKS